MQPCRQVCAPFTEACLWGAAQRAYQGVEALSRLQSRRWAAAWHMGAAGTDRLLPPPQDRACAAAHKRGQGIAAALITHAHTAACTGPASLRQQSCHLAHRHLQQAPLATMAGTHLAALALLLLVLSPSVSLAGPVACTQSVERTLHKAALAALSSCSRDGVS